MTVLSGITPSIRMMMAVATQKIILNFFIVLNFRICTRSTGDFIICCLLAGTLYSFPEMHKLIARLPPNNFVYGTGGLA
jgi:hypothetical protein